MKRLYIDGEIGWWPNTEATIRYKLKSFGGEDVEVVINSPGGSVIEGVAIFNLLREYKGSVTTVVNAMAASMASYIALAGDVVKVYDNATYMIHNVWSVIAGDHNDMRKQADIQESLTALLANKYAEKTGKSVDEIRTMMDSESWFFGKEVVDAGFADEVIESGVGSSKADALAHAKSLLGAVNRVDEPTEALVAALSETSTRYPLPATPSKDVPMKRSENSGTTTGGMHSHAEHGNEKKTTGGMHSHAEHGNEANEKNVGCDCHRTENQHEGETMAQEPFDWKAVTAQTVMAEAPEVAAAIAQQERERMIALEEVDPLGLNADTFAGLQSKAKTEGWDKATLVVAVHEALVAQRKAEDEARQAQAQARAEDGQNLADMIQDIQPGSGTDAKTKAEKAAAEAQKAMAIAKQMNGGE